MGWTLLLLLFASVDLIFPTKDSYLKAIYWEVKPFIFTNEKGDVDGIIPRIFQQGEYYCLKNSTKSHLITFNESYRLNREEFHHALHYLDPGHMHFNISKEESFWAPVISDTHHKEVHSDQEKDFVVFQLMKSTEIAVIVPRSMISLPNKILRGIFACQQVFVIAFLLAILFGILVWVVEHYKNNSFPRSFLQGMGKGLWWSLVSMTTVGYGDVVPESSLGRSVALFWLFIGMMIGCVMTATMTDVVSGVSDLSVYGKTVSVLENSYEEKVASQDFRAKIVPSHSYEQALEFVRRGKVFAAMINGDVAAWYQDEIQDDNADVPLRVVQKLPAKLYINCFISDHIPRELKKIIQCMYFREDEIYTHSIEHYKRYLHTETLYIGSVLELFYQNKYIRLLSVLVLGLVVMGSVLDIVRHVSDYLKGKDYKTVSKVVRSDTNGHGTML